MTKKDFELIAGVLKQAILFCDDTQNKDDDILLLETLSNRFANILASKNPRFQKDKFLKACGVEIKCNLCDKNVIDDEILCYGCLQSEYNKVNKYNGVEVFDSEKFEKINGYKPSFLDKRWFEIRKK